MLNESIPRSQRVARNEKVELTVWCALKLRTVRFLPQWIRTVPSGDAGDVTGRGYAGPGPGLLVTIGGSMD